MPCPHHRPIPESVTILLEVVDKELRCPQNVVLKIYGMRCLKVGEQSPGSHRSRGCSLHVSFCVITLLVFTKPSVFLLHIGQPFGDVDYPRLPEVVTDPCETGKHSSDCVDIVYAPTRVPHPFFAGTVEILQSSADYLSVLNSGLTHALEDMSHDVCAGRVEYLCALIDFGGPKQKFDKGKLIIIFVLIEGRKAAVVVLVGSHPSVCSIGLVLEEMLELSSSEVLLHLSV